MENEEGVQEKWVAAWQHLKTGEECEEEIDGMVFISRGDGGT